MTELHDSPWLCACPGCQAARNQLQRCKLKAERKARSQRIFKRLAARAPEDCSDHLLEAAIGKQLRKYKEAGLGPALPLNLVYDLGLDYDELDRVVAALQRFVRKGWVLEVNCPEGASNPTKSYRIVK